MVLSIDTQYKITRRYMDGVRVLGYELIDILKPSVRFMLSKEETSKLATMNRIVNCKAQTYGGETQLKGIGCKLNQLESISLNGNTITRRQDKPEPKPYTIVRRLTSGRETVGYELQYRDSIKSVSKQDTLKLIQSGLVANARVQRCGEKQLIRGVGCDLDMLPVLNAAYR